MHVRWIRKAAERMECLLIQRTILLSSSSLEDFVSNKVDTESIHSNASCILIPGKITNTVYYKVSSPASLWFVFFQW